MSHLNNIFNYFGYLIRAKTSHGVHSPFVYKFITELLESYNEDFYQFKELEIVRKQLLKNNKQITITDFGSGSKIFKSNVRKISSIAKYGISEKKFSELYFKIINYFNAKTIVELGTSVGLNTLYLSKANAKATIYTIEGCSELYKFSNELFIKHKCKNIKNSQGKFDDEFPKILNAMTSLDVLFVDGNHNYQSTLNYFQLALAKKNNNSVFIFDDINWSDAMQKAWLEIRNHKEVTLSIDLYQIGIVFFRAEQKQKEHFVLKY